ncbi:DUF177 domain-containing protein [candidate division KSB1 bacterium]|nr:DUF177 domain-containing protein [candidate division KSB1 bacterium]
MIIQLTKLHEGSNLVPYEHTTATLELESLDGFDGVAFPHTIEIRTDIQKVNHQYFVNVNIITTAQMICDRCLETFDKSINEKFRLIYAVETFPIDPNETEGEFRTLDTDAINIDITADIREALLLMIPMKTLCSEECRGLCPQCGTNLNKEGCNCSNDQIDPRWEALSKLKSSLS